MQLTGLHHVTAITGKAAANVDFYTRVMGMRLVKKTVNQDDVSAYHLFYADAHGSPGTDVTFFDWPDVVENRNGAGTIARIALRVNGRPALETWEKRFNDLGVPHSPIVEEFGRARLAFQDPEGQTLALIDDGGEPGGTPWPQSPIPVEMGIRGLHSVNLMVQDAALLTQVLTMVMGFEPAGTYLADERPDRRVQVFAAGTKGPGREVHVEAGLHLPPGRQGRGGVHHVAFRTPNAEEQELWRERLFSAGLQVTPVIDRFYFKSIYFRVPGGILFEIATDGPGFATDEDAEHLGEQLALPPFLEPRRAQIESMLKPLEV